MLDNIKLYIIAILLAATLGLGYTSYVLTGKLAVSEDSISMWKDTANKNAAAVKTVTDRCAISIGAVQDAMKEINSLSESRTSDLEALASLPQVTLPEIKVNGTKTSTTPPTGFVDGDRISPDLMRLLDSAYCSGNKDDPYCTAR